MYHHGTAARVLTSGHPPETIIRVLTYGHLPGPLNKTRQRGHTLSTCTVLTQALCTSCPPPSPVLFSRLSGLAGSGPILSFLRFFSFHLSLPRFPHGAYNSCAVSCASSPSPRPSRSFSRSRPHSHPVFVHGLSTPVPVPAPVPAPILCSFVRLHPLARSRSRSTPFTVPSPELVPISVPAPDSDPAPDRVRSFRFLGPGYPSVRCACMGTRLCERSCRVPARATPCLTR